MSNDLDCIEDEYQDAGLYSTEDEILGDLPSPEGFNPPRRFHLADERASRTVHFSLMGREAEAVEGTFTVGLFADGTPGELFIDCESMGDEVSGLADCWAIGVSMLLQYGVDPRIIYKKFKFQDFIPNGVTGNPAVPIAKSLVDFVCRWMEVRLPPTADVSPRDLEWVSAVREVIDH